MEFLVCSKQRGKLGKAVFLETGNINICVLINVIEILIPLLCFIPSLVSSKKIGLAENVVFITL